MKISYQIVGDGAKLTDPLREAVIRCFDRALKYCTVPPTVNAVLRFDKHQAKEKQNTVTVTVRAEGKEQIARTSTTDDMYKSIDQVSELVEREISERKKAKKKRIPRILVDQPMPHKKVRAKVA